MNFLTKRIFLYLLFLFQFGLISSCSSETEETSVIPDKEEEKKEDGGKDDEEEKEITLQVISPTDPNIQYHGRIDFSNAEAPILYWAGTAVTANFKGTVLNVLMDDGNNENYYKVIIDGQEEQAVDFKTNSGQTNYPIKNDLEEGGHRVDIFRRIGAAKEGTKFLGLEVDSDHGLAAPPEFADLKIEFYGNSITSGHGVLDASRSNNSDYATWDNYYAYGAQTARNLDAQYRCISKSGIGLMISWFPLIMPEMYDRVDPADSNSKWDFSIWKPDIVVVNIFQNDSWLISRISPEPTSDHIIKAYEDFVLTLRSKYPSADIICALGNMDATKSNAPWPGYIESAVNNIKNTHGDEKVYSMIFPFKNSGAHPTKSEQKAMADQLTSFIKENLL